MDNFVSSPNLPKCVKNVIISSKYSDILDKPLQNLGIIPIYVPENPSVDSRLSGHTDLSIFHGGGDQVFLAPYLKNTKTAEKLAEIGLSVHFTGINQAEKYPFDAQMNVCAFGNSFIYNSRTASSEIVDYLTNSGRQGIDCRQGYSKCSVCVLNENAVITSDRGIADAASENNIDVLLIDSGGIKLKGFDYGFIGGAAFKISSNTIAFTGTLDLLSRKETILSFLCYHNIEPVFLTGQPAFDIGGAVPLTEK
ncbi:MAG: DUF6873 family GME fold protein [Candidatus Limivicinus sp.]|jgi:hypothetical protein